MPTYDFENTKTGEVTTEFMSIAELDNFKKNNPHMKHCWDSKFLLPQ